MHIKGNVYPQEVLEEGESFEDKINELLVKNRYKYHNIKFGENKGQKYTKETFTDFILTKIQNTDNRNSCYYR